MTARREATQRAWVLPREPASVRLMNTIWADRAGVHDDLASPDDLAAWMNAVGLAAEAAPVTAADLRESRRLRDALRRIAALSTDDDREVAASPLDLDTALGVINNALARRPTARLAVRAGRLEREAATAASPIACALAAVAHDAMGLFTEPERGPLRACHAPGCVLYFVQSHPRRAWCSVACGNRERAARRYERVRVSRQH